MGAAGGTAKCYLFSQATKKIIIVTRPQTNTQLLVKKYFLVCS